MVLGDGLVVADDLADDEVQELLREGRVQVGLGGEAPQPGDLRRFAARVPGGKLVRGLEEADLLGGLEALGEEEDEGGIDVVDAGADRQQLRHHRGIHGPASELAAGS